MKEPQKEKPANFYLGLGFALAGELSGAMIVVWLLGGWVDDEFAIAPYGTMALAVVITVAVVFHIVKIYNKYD